jgi:DNA-directed RNA polymerase subunit M/transcription elongation factor TFIIS
MSRIQISILIFIILCLAAGDAFSFRCGSGMVSAGDSKARVLIVCGKPTAKEKVSEKTKTSTGVVKNKTKKSTNKAEVWYYNCGSQDYIYALTFEDGVLKKEDTEGKGSGKSDCLGK